MLAWQKAQELALLMYKLFGKNTDYGFRDQIQRASISVSNNIAEGFERNSNKEMRNFMYIAKGSCGEVRSMLGIARSLNYIDEANYNNSHNLALETSRLISGFIKTL